MIKRDTISWALYDFANSAFATTVMAGFFPIFFKEYYSKGVDVTTSTAILGFANSFASFLIVLISPLLGAIADSLSAKKKFLSFFTYLGILMTFSLSFCQKGDWEFAIFFYVMGTIGFSGALTFYDSLLPFVSTLKERDFVSGLGFSLGYLGGGILFIINVLMYIKPHIFGIENHIYSIEISFISVAIWWAIFSIPIFLFVEEPNRAKKGTILEGYQKFIRTFKKIKEFKIILLFLIAYWFYIDGVDTIIRMAVDYGISIGFNSKDLILALLLIQFIAFPSTIIFAKLGEIWDTKKAILLAIGIYLIIVIWAVIMKSKEEFYLIATLIGLVQGGIQALSRSFYSKLIPIENSAEFFGFYNMMGKFAVILGPLLMSITALVTKDSRISMASVTILFVIGGILLMRVEEKS